MIKSLLFVLMAHMVGDYLFQSDYLAMNKGKDNYILLAHSILYTVGVMFVAYIMSIEISLYGFKTKEEKDFIAYAREHKLNYSALMQM